MQDKALLISSALCEIDTLTRLIRPNVAYLIYDYHGTEASLIAKIEKFIQAHAQSHLGIITHGSPGLLDFSEKIKFTNESLENPKEFPHVRALLKTLTAQNYSTKRLDLIACNLRQGEEGERLISSMQQLLHRPIGSSRVPLGRGHWKLDTRGFNYNLQYVYFKRGFFSWHHQLALALTTPSISSSVPYFDGITTSLKLSPIGTFGGTTTRISLDAELYGPVLSSQFTPLGQVRNEWQTLLEIGVSPLTPCYALDWDPVYQLLRLRQGSATTPFYTSIYTVTPALTITGQKTNLLINFTAFTLTAQNITLSTATTSGSTNIKSFEYTSLTLGKSLNKTNPNYFMGRLDNLKIENNGALLGSWYWTPSETFAGTSKVTPPRLIQALQSHQQLYKVTSGFTPQLYFTTQRITLLYNQLLPAPKLQRLDSNQDLVIASEYTDPEFRIALSRAVMLNRLCKTTATTGLLFNDASSALLPDPGLQAILTSICTTIMASIPNFDDVTNYLLFSDTTSSSVQYPSQVAGSSVNATFADTMFNFYLPYGTHDYSLPILKTQSFLERFFQLLEQTQEIPLSISRYPGQGLSKNLQPISQRIHQALNGKLTELQEQLSTVKRAITVVSRWLRALTDSKYPLNFRGEICVPLKTANYSITTLGDEWVCTSSDLRLRRVHLPLYAFSLAAANQSFSNFPSIAGFDLMAFGSTFYSIYQELSTLISTSPGLATFNATIENLLTSAHLPTQYPPQTSIKNAVAAYTVDHNPINLPANAILPNTLANPLGGTTCWSATGASTLYIFPCNQDGSIGVNLVPWSTISAANATNNSLHTITGEFACTTNTTASQYYNRYYWTFKLFESPLTRPAITSALRSLNSISEELNNEIQKTTSSYQTSMQILSQLCNKEASIVKTITNGIS
jgi:prefoldin subunit 5